MGQAGFCLACGSMAVGAQLTGPKEPNTRIASVRKLDPLVLERVADLFSGTGSRRVVAVLPPHDRDLRNAGALGQVRHGPAKQTSCCTHMLDVNVDCFLFFLHVLAFLSDG